MAETKRPVEQLGQSGKQRFVGLDEIELKELLQTWWKERWIIIGSMILFVLVALIYLSSTQEWGASRAIVNKKTLVESCESSILENKIQGIFTHYQDNNAGVTFYAEMRKDDSGVFRAEVFSESEARRLNEITRPSYIYDMFVKSYSSEELKRMFLSQNEVFKNYSSEMSEKEKEELLVEWCNKINVKPIKELGDELVMAAPKGCESLFLLKSYIGFINSSLTSRLEQELTTVIKQVELKLIEKRDRLIVRAKHEQKLEIERAKLALIIADAAKIEYPIMPAGGIEFFPVNLGSRAIRAKISVLEHVDKYEFFIPELLGVNIALENFSNLVLSDSFQLQPVSYVSFTFEKMNEHRRGRWLVVITGFLLGCIVGVGIVTFRKGLGLN